MDVQVYLYEEAKRHLRMIPDRGAVVRFMALVDSMNNALIQHYSEGERELIHQYLLNTELHADVPPRIRRQSAAIAEVLLSIEQCANQSSSPPESNFPVFATGIALILGGFAIALFLPNLLVPLLSAYTTPITLAKLYKLSYLGYVAVAAGAYGIIVDGIHWWEARRSDRHKRFFPKLSRR